MNKRMFDTVLAANGWLPAHDDVINQMYRTTWKKDGLEVHTGQMEEKSEVSIAYGEVVEWYPMSLIRDNQHIFSHVLGFDVSQLWS